jgi:hypothetical protein
MLDRTDKVLDSVHEGILKPVENVSALTFYRVTSSPVSVNVTIDAKAGCKTSSANAEYRPAMRPPNSKHISI